jgi:autotransporter-associated beta strand protein
MKELPEDLQAKIIAYIDGDLPADQAAALEVYLANTDPGLSEMVIGMMADRHGVSVLPKIRAPQDLSARVMEQLERNSLLHGVEDDLTRPHRSWWQTRAAIAAALTIVLGGFTYFVIHSVYRPNGTIDKLTQPLAAVTPEDNGKSRDGVGGGSTERGAVASGAVFGGSGGGGGGGISGNSGEISAAAPEPSHDPYKRLVTGDAADDLNFALAKAKGGATHAGAPKSLILDMEAPSEESVMHDRAVLQSGDLAAAAKKGYDRASNAQQALADVHAGPDNTIDGPPVVLYCQARDSQDPARLQRQLAAYMENTLDAKVNIIRTSQYSPNGLTVNGGSLTLSGANTYSGNTTLAAGNLTLGNAAVATNVGGSLNPAKEESNVAFGGSDSIVGSISNGNSSLTLGGLNDRIDQKTQAGTVAVLNSGNTIAGLRTNVDNGAPDLNAKTAVDTYAGNTVRNGGKLNITNNTLNNDNGTSANFDANDVKFLQQGGETQRNYRVYNVNTYGRQNAKAAEQSAAKQRVDDSDTFVGATGMPYRVYLRPEQLNQLTTEFRVLSINRGQAKYVIPPADEAARRDRGVHERAETKSSPGAQNLNGIAPAAPDFGGFAPAESARAAAVQTATPATASANAMVGKAPGGSASILEGRSEVGADPQPNARPAVSSGASVTIAQEHTVKDSRRLIVPRAGETAPNKGEAIRKSDVAQAPAEDRWIEVIITMDPPPTAAGPVGTNSKPGPVGAGATIDQAGK